MLQLFAFFLNFWIFCWTSLKLRFLKVDKGLLQDKITSYDHFICFGIQNINTQIYTNFRNFYN